MNLKQYQELIEEAKKQGINRHVVGAVIMKDSKVLLLQRPKDDFMGGIFELPSGKVEDGEDLSAALHREVKEETGLNIKEIKKYLDNFDYESKSGKKTRQFSFAVTMEESFEIKLEEHDSYVWAGKEELQEYPVTDSVKQILSSCWCKK